jgi:hypothetical protein
MNPDTDPRRVQLVAEREELSRTVQALADRFDVGARARSVAGNVRGRGARGWDQVVRSKPFVPVAAVVGAGLTLLGTAMVRRQETRRRETRGMEARRMETRRMEGRRARRRETAHQLT